jgi:serine O-acetyltransferase
LDPARLWYLSIRLQRRSPRLALLVKRLNALLHHNSLPPQCKVGPELHMAHSGFGVMIHPAVEIGRGVKIWHHVTLTARHVPGRAAHLIVEDHVRIGAHAIVITPRGETMRIGRGARIGAGAVVTSDVPPGATVFGPQPTISTDKAEARLAHLDRKFGPAAVGEPGDETLGERLS